MYRFNKIIYAQILSLLLALFILQFGNYDDIITCFQNLTDTIWSVSYENLKVKPSKNRATKKPYFRLPNDVNKIKVELKNLHKLWKDNGSLNHGMHFQVLQEKKANTCVYFIVSCLKKRMKISPTFVMQLTLVKNYFGAC